MAPNVFPGVTAPVQAWLPAKSREISPHFAVATRLLTHSYRYTYRTFYNTVRTILSIKMFLQEHFFHSPRDSPSCTLHRPCARQRQFCLLPGIKSAHHIDHIPEARTLQQAAGDQAAISPLAVHRDGRIVINLWRGDPEVVERPPGRALNVSGIPLRFPAHIKHLHLARLHVARLQPRVEVTYADLRDGRQGKSGLFPRRKPALEISIQNLDPDSRQPQPGFF